MILRFGPFELDEEVFELRRDGVAIHVEPKVLDVLLYLVRHRDRLVSKQELLEQVWPDAVVAESALTRAMSLARSVIGDTARGQGAIETVAGRGYRFRAEVAAEAPSKRGVSRARLGRSLAVPAGAVLLLLAAAGWLTWPAPLGVHMDLAGLRDPRRNPSLPDRPSVVVLPFTDLSPHAPREYLADGITEDVTTGLAKFRDFFVIARNSAFSYKGKPTDIDQVARELGVRYVVEGSTRATDERILVTAQLIDAATGFHVWSARYDRKVDNVLDLQTDISTEILEALGVQIEAAELERLGDQATVPPGAYAALVQGRAFWRRFTRADHERARELFERALTLEPDYASAYAYLATIHVAAYGLGWDPVPQRLEQGSLLVRRAMELDPADPLAHSALAGILLWTGRAEEVVVAAAKRAVDLRPTGDSTYGMLAMALAAEGRPREAIDALNGALRLNPRHPSPYWMLLGYLQAAAGRLETAVEVWERVRTSNADLIPPRVELIGYYGERDRYAEARALAEEILRVNPAFSAEVALRLDRRRTDPRAALRLREQLQRAGLP